MSVTVKTHEYKLNKNLVDNITNIINDYYATISDEEYTRIQNGLAYFHQQIGTIGENYMSINTFALQFSNTISSSNSIYIIDIDFNLNNSTVTIPTNSVLLFRGGSISNGSIVLQNTYIDGYVKFNNVTISGSCTNEVLTPQMFGAYPSLTETESNKTQHTLAFQNLASVVNNVGTFSKNIYISSGHYSINACIQFMTGCTFHGDGESSVIDFYDGSGGLGFGYVRSGNHHYYASCELLDCTITQDVNKEDEYIYLTDTSDLNVGDYIILTDTKDRSFNLSRVYYRTSELVKISMIDTTTNKVTFASKLYGKYFYQLGENYSSTLGDVATVNNTRRTAISKFTPSQYNISDIKLFSHEHNNSSPNTYYTLVVCGIKDSIFNNIIIENYGNQVPCCLKLGIHYNVSNCVIRNFARYAIDAYGLSINTSQDFTVRHSTFRAPSHALSTSGGNQVYDINNRNFIYEDLHFENCDYDNSESDIYPLQDLDVHGDSECYKYLNINCPNLSCTTGGYNVVIENCKFYKVTASFNESDMTIRNTEIFAPSTVQKIWNESAFDHYTNNSITFEGCRIHGEMIFDYQNSSSYYDNLIFRRNVCEYSHPVSSGSGGVQIRNGKIHNIVFEDNSFGAGCRLYTYNCSYDNISIKRNVFLDGFCYVKSANISFCVFTDNYINTLTDPGSQTDSQAVILSNVNGYMANNIVMRGVDDSRAMVQIIGGTVKVNNNIFKILATTKSRYILQAHNATVIANDNIHNSILDNIIYNTGDFTSGITDRYYSLSSSNVNKLSSLDAYGKTFYIEKINRLCYGSVKREGDKVGYFSFNGNEYYIGANPFICGKLYITAAGGYGTHSLYLSKYNDITNENFESGLLWIIDFSYDNKSFQIKNTTTEYPYIYVTTNRPEMSCEFYPCRAASEYDGAAINVNRRGTTSNRPGGYEIYVGFIYIDTDLGKPIYAKTVSNNTVTWVESDGAIAGVRRVGTTSERPTGSNIYVGFKYNDTTIDKEIYASAISGNTVTWTEVNSEKPVNIVNVTYSELTNNTLNTNINNYYNISGSVGTLNVTLNHTSENVIQKIIINLSTGSTPQITFNPSTNGETISYFDYYSINANSNYELNIIWNGTKWIIAYNSYYNS